MSEQKDWGIREAVEQGARWDTLSHSHPAKVWGLERSKLEIMEAEGVMTYKEREFIPASRVKAVVKSLHKGYRGVTLGQQKAH